MRIILFLIFNILVYKVLSKTIDRDTTYLADDPNLNSYFVTYVNDTKVVTKLSDINKKYLK